MVRLLVEAAGGMPVEDGPAKGRPFDRVAIATPRAMAAGEDKFKLARARLAEQPHGGTAKKSVLAAVMLHLLVDHVGILGAVQAEKNLLHHRLLILIEEFVEGGLGDMPVVVDLGTQRMIEGKTN